MVENWIGKIEFENAPIYDRNFLRHVCRLQDVRPLIFDLLAILFYHLHTEKSIHSRFQSTV